MCLKKSCFPDRRKVLLVVPVFKNVEERNMGIHYYVAIFLISSVVSGLLDQLQIFC